MMMLNLKYAPFQFGVTRPRFVVKKYSSLHDQQTTNPIDTRIIVLVMFRLALAVENNSFGAAVCFAGCPLVSPCSATNIVRTLFPVVEFGA